MVANSIGAFFALSSLDETLVDQAFLISPVMNMENLICNIMQWANVTEQELAENREIATNFGETLSWEYLCYVRQHPIIWNVPTCILYGEHDNLTSLETVSAFVGEQTVVAVSSYFRPAVHDCIDFIEHILLPIIQNH